MLGTDHALWRRLWLVPFDATFYDRADDVPAGKREPGRWVKDTKLPARLAAELPGVLAWLVRGCLEWQRRGLHPLPKRVEAATRAYRSEMDTLAAFLKERCQEGPNCSVFATPLWEAFKAWCDQAGEQPGKQREFGQRMTERGFHRRDSTGGRARYYGVGLREDDRPRRRAQVTHLRLSPHLEVRRRVTQVTPNPARAAHTDLIRARAPVSGSLGSPRAGQPEKTARRSGHPDRPRGYRVPRVLRLSEV